jgi:hypothetical protein
MRTHRLAGLLAMLSFQGCDLLRTGSDLPVEASDSLPTKIISLESRVHLARERTALIGGGQDVDPHHTLHLIRGAVLLDSGLVAIASEGTQSLRFYDLAGNYAGERGGAGDGPGEYRRIRSLQRIGSDSLAVWDAGPRRLTLLGVGSPETETLTLPGLGVNHFPPRTQPLDVYVVGESLVVAFRGAATDIASGFSRDSGYLAFIRRIDTAQTSVGPLLGTEYYRGNGTMAAPYGYRLHMTALPQALVVGDGLTPHLTIYPVGGSPARRLTLPIIRRPMSDADRQSVRSAFLNNRVSPGDRPSIGRLFDEAMRADSFPAYTRLVATSAGDLWVRLHTRSDSARWLIVEPEQRCANYIDLPAHWSVLDSDGERVLLFSTDELGREQVEIYALVMS